MIFSCRNYKKHDAYFIRTIIDSNVEIVIDWRYRLFYSLLFLWTLFPAWWRRTSPGMPRCSAAARWRGELQPLTHMWPDGFKSTANTHASADESARKVRVFALRSVVCVFISPEARGGKRAEVSVWMTADANTTSRVTLINNSLN